MNLIGFLLDMAIRGLGVLRVPLNTFRRTGALILERYSKKLPERELYFIAHSHLDAAWLWTRDRTVAKARRTFQNALNNMERFRFFSFAQSAPQYYVWMERLFPDIFREIKRRVSEGRWVPVGGMWVEPDVNMPDGEALVRHELYGQRFYLSRFGRISRVEWLPDSFGFPWTLPQIFAKSGIKYFWTTKITWNDTNIFPFALFEWKAPDGSSVLTYIAPLAMAYWMDPKPLPPPVLLESKKEFDYSHLPDNSEFRGMIAEEGVFYGVGDGGGGPLTEEIIMVNGFLELGYHHSSPEAFFKMLDKKYRKNVPVWNDELYLEFHRGVFTSQALVKKYNRKCENALISVEALSTIAWKLSQMPFPEDLIHKAWKLLLFNQFHDILPGSSIREVYETAYHDYELILETAQELANQAMDAIAKKFNIPKKSVLLFNPLSWERDAIVTIPGSWRILEGNKELPSYTDGSTTTFIATALPSYGFKAFELREGKCEIDTGLILTESSASNGIIYFELDRKGNVAHIKVNEKEILREPITMHFYRDKPHIYDAWEIDRKLRKQKLEEQQLVSITPLDERPLAVGFRVVHSFRKSIFAHEYRIYAGKSELYCTEYITWNERHVLVKERFPLKTLSTHVTAEIPYGCKYRPAKPSNKFEAAQYEWCAQKWVDASNGKEGVVLVNDGKYGYSVFKDALEMTLLRGPTYPDKNADKGKHEFSWALIYHEGDWKNAWRHGYEFNRAPIYRIVEPSNGDMSLPWSFVSIKSNHTGILSIKKHEDSNRIVLRVVNLGGVGENIDIQFVKEIGNAWSSDLLELNHRKLKEINEDTIKYKIKRFSIDTILVDI